MTHEFKTPISTIKLALDAIDNKKIKNDLNKRNKYLKMIKDENERMNFQVENVLRISQLDRSDNILKKTRCDIHNLINKALVHLDLLIKNRNVKIELNLRAKQSNVFVSKESFVNVFVNILENAIKYSHEKPVITISSNQIDDNLEIQIKDNGIGMSSSVKKKYFLNFTEKKWVMFMMLKDMVWAWHMSKKLLIYMMQKFLLIVIWVPEAHLICF